MTTFDLPALREAAARYLDSLISQRAEEAGRQFHAYPGVLHMMAQRETEQEYRTLQGFFAFLTQEETDAQRHEPYSDEMREGPRENNRAERGQNPGDHAMTKKLPIDLPAKPTMWRTLRCQAGQIILDNAHDYGVVLLCEAPGEGGELDTATLFLTASQAIKLAQALLEAVTDELMDPTETQPANEEEVNG